MLKEIAIGGIIVLEAIALLVGINGTIFALAIAAIAGIAGYEMRIGTERRKK